jgi:hypothetical protein
MKQLYFALASFALAVSLGLLFLEMHLRSKRTRVVQVPGGLCFEAQKFSVQFQRREKEVHVQCARGVLVPALTPPEQEPPKAGRVACKFAAVGFRVEVRESVRQQADQAAPVLTGYSEISMRGADEMALTIPQVDPGVAADFAFFFRQVSHWIDKLEKRLERERVADLRREEEAMQAQQDAGLLADLLSRLSPNEVPSDAARDAIVAAQIDQWRQITGFQGQHSAWQADAQGVVEWFVDLSADGRITLHADNRTLHSTLHGASITSTGAALLVSVRDAYWTQEEPELRAFKVLRLGPDERRAWKERLEIIRNSLSVPGDGVSVLPGGR